jgi:hypothetical protein
MKIVAHGLGILVLLLTVPITAMTVAVYFLLADTLGRSLKRRRMERVMAAAVRA